MPWTTYTGKQKAKNALGLQHIKQAKCLCLRAASARSLWRWSLDVEIAVMFSKSSGNY